MEEVGVFGPAMISGLQQEGEMDELAGDLEDLDDAAVARYLHNDAPWPHNLPPVMVPA